MELSKRLQAVIKLLDCHDRIADIGCDHGFVSIYLVEKNIASFCLAMDVNQGPLERAREHIEEKRLSTYIETRLSNGANEIRYLKNEYGENKLEVDAALIAGMGGRLMITIIEESKDKFCNMKEFVLQPQSELTKVRQYLRENGYHILKEDMVWEDGKFYPMMKVIPAKHADTINTIRLNQNTSSLQKLYDEYGKYLLDSKHPVLLQFLEKEKGNYQEILHNLKQKETLKSRLRQKEIMEKLENINLGLGWFKNEM